MRLCDYISKDLVFIIDDAGDKPTFLKKVVSLVQERYPALDKDRLLGRLMEREEQVTTGIGHGVAIPHAAVDGLESTLCVVAQVPGGIDFQALDASPVHVIFLLLSPPGSTGTHIRLLARIARLVDEETFVLRMAQAHGAEELYEVVSQEDCRHV